MLYRNPLLQRARFYRKRGNVQILLVEDDLPIRQKHCARGLELAGFRVCWLRLLADAVSG